ncbi:uncharacterized protein LOC124541364 [Vanessa cardui]|uniref:uncharacterized protein LOC124541364 n=1 Tax=Vanessa cardui TaxID=171605 RepID=UPI001F12EB3F|nr:uncharacterized protein LOC124541364 [Vanessa cardui]
MDQSLQMSTNFDEIVKMFDSRMKVYEDRLKKLSPSCSAPAMDLKSLTSEFLDFKTFVWKTLTLMKSHVEMLTLGLERHEAYLRRKVVLIHGVAEEKNETLSSVIMNILSSHLELSDVSTSEIQVCHRLGVHKGKPRPILVRFNNLSTRQLVWNSKTLLKGTGITLSEFLTRSKHHVFMEARKEFGVNRCWTSDGKIIILLPDKTRRKVEVLSDLHAVAFQVSFNFEIATFA